ncbi:hypothetical protein V4V35_25500 [Bacillus infantis]|uniref:hypothetical protein n=1 Tax=Bacillus infantis TaxID=324767 RepID=UPI002FBF0ED3
MQDHKSLSDEEILALYLGLHGLYEDAVKNNKDWFEYRLELIDVKSEILGRMGK